MLAVLAYADGNGGPTHPLPFPHSKEGRSITVTDSRGFSPHSSDPSEALFARAPDGAALYSVVCFQYRPRTGGGVNPQTFAACNLRYDSVPRITFC